LFALRSSSYLRSGGLPLKIALRVYRPEDFEALYKIDQACYSTDVAYSRSDLRAYLGFLGSECVVAELQGGESSAKKTGEIEGPRVARIIGFCVSAHRDREGYIITLDVLGPYRRQRVGTALLKDIEKRLEANGVRRVGLETATDNDAAVAFWRRHGYRVRGVRKGYYPGGRDAYSMNKRIAPSDAHER
jgi:[ribosomal protein S18]-alanine N-acetyltransferase